MNARHAPFSLVATLLASLSAPVIAEPPEYTAIEVGAWPPSQGPLPFFKRFVPSLPAGAPTNLDAMAQTSSGYVCGDLPGNWYSTSATRVHDGSAEYLTPFGQHSWGYWTFDGDDWHYIFGYVRYTHAMGINYAGDMVGNSTIAGSSDYASGANTHAYHFSTSEGMLDLTPEAIRSDANSINNRGEIVGWQSSATGVYSGFRRSPDGAMTSLDPLDGSVSYPSAINGLGVVVGRAGTKAFVSSSGPAAHDLGMPDTGDIEAVAAYDINDGNWIAGAGWKIAQPYEHFAVIWEPLPNGAWLPWELSEMLITPDILLENALAINESGYIIATGRPDGSDNFGSHLYILTPVTPLIPPCRPDIGVHPQRSVVVAPGESFDLGVELAGGQGPFAYHWSRDGAPLEDGP